MKCKECVSYGLYRMVTSGQPYGYAGVIPCLSCTHFSPFMDHFEPVDKKPMCIGDLKKDKA